MARTKNTARKVMGGPAEKCDLDADTATEVENTLPSPIAVPASKSDDTANNLCTICLNGGYLFICSCRHTVCAQNCLPGVDFYANLGDFTCPACFKNKNSEEPYKPFSLSDQLFAIPLTLNTRSLFPYMASDSMVILSLRLEGSSAISSASSIIYAHLFDYFDQKGPMPDLELIEIVFNLSTKSSRSKYTTDLAAILPQLARFKRFLVFVVGHSTPDTGDIWIKPGPDPAAASLEQFFNCMFSPALLAHIKRDPAASLFLMLCGGPFLHKESFKEIFDFVTPNFWLTWGFTKAEFHPSIAHTFLMKVADRIYINCQPAVLDDLLQGETDLGAHAEGVICFVGANINLVAHYTWHHDFLRPNGQKIPVSCEKCFRIKHWEKVSTSKNEVVLQCKYCQSKSTIHCPPLEGAFSVSKHAKGCHSTGAWQVQYLNSDSEVVSKGVAIHYPF
ncbi:hypothetical protein FPV67DRAFT_1779657 [Lyophyllum atratum]|nr:hypothetical protein FPV67DRAFT_1779657 [Lyophyllum atratum]